MGIARQRQVEKVLDGLGRPRRGEESAPLEPPQDVKDLEVEEVGSVQGDAAREKAAAKARSLWRTQENVDDDGCVDYGQSGPLKRRISAALPLNFTGWRLSRRLRISSGVGRSATRRASARR